MAFSSVKKKVITSGDTETNWNNVLLSEKNKHAWSHHKKKILHLLCCKLNAAHHQEKHHPRHEARWVQHHADNASL